MAARLRAVPVTAPRAIAYIRVSTERDEMISPELQETAIRDHCARSGYELTEVLSDLDLSGRFWKRRQIERAIGLIEAGSAEVIVVWKISRVARNRLDWNIAVDRVETVGGRLESATEPIDTSTSSGRFSRGILAELAAFESERAGEQWSETHRRRWKNGLPHSGRPRFGYTYERGAGYSVDPTTGPIVREMYNRYMQGDTYDAIRRWLAPMNLGTMRTHKSVSDFLDAGFGAGVIVHHDPECPIRHTGGKANVSCRNKVREPGAHVGVISEVEYDEYLLERARRRFVPPRLKAPLTAFAGLIWCTSCGSRYVHHRRDSGASHYRCGNAKFCEGPSSIARSRLETLVLEWLAPFADEINSASPGRNGPSSVEAVERDRLARVALEADSALTQLAIDFARRIVPEAAYLAARDSLTAERDAASARVSALSSIQQNSRRNRAMANDLIVAWPEMTDPERNRVLKELVLIHITRTTAGPSVSFFESWNAPGS